MRRRLLLLLCAILPTLGVGSAPPAHALGGAVCLISGTIRFDQPADAAGTGAWDIAPGQINCNGVIKGYRIFGTGHFHGSGTYEARPAGACLQLFGTGTVDYIMRSGAMVWHMVEEQRLVLAGAGEIATPTLRGPAKLAPPYDGDCLTQPVRSAFFVAEVVMVNHHGILLPQLPI